MSAAPTLKKFPKALLCGLAVAALNGCSRSGITIEIAVPNDFKGAVEVIPNQADGVSPA